MENKLDLRVKIKILRKSLDIVRISGVITKNIMTHPVFVQASDIMIYYPLKYEINLLKLIDLAPNKNFYFPKVDGEKLLVCPNCNDFEKSDMNIFEPCSNPVSPEILDLVIVPALAVDEEHFRLGYGGGFYDKFLSQNNNIKSLTPICKDFIYKSLPKENFDRQIDFIVSD